MKPTRSAVADEPAALPSLQLRVRVPETVLMRQVGEELVMLNLARENYHALDPVGARLMQVAQSGATLEQIAERLLEEFDAARELIVADVRRIAGELIAAGLLEPAPPP
jgi:hypothetical protein